MHKTVTTLALALLFTLCAHAQDLITKRNGDDIMVKVTLVGKTEIQYKQLDNLDGPAYVMPIAEIFSIKYFNGDKKFYGDVPAPATTNTANCDSLTKVAKGQKTAGIIFAVTGPIEAISGAVLLGIGIGSLQPATSPSVNNTDAYLNIALGSVFAVAGTVFTCLAPVYFDKHKQTKAALKNCGTGAYLKPFITGSSTSASAGMRITF